MARYPSLGFPYQYNPYNRRNHITDNRIKGNINEEIEKAQEKKEKKNCVENSKEEHGKSSRNSNSFLPFTLNFDAITGDSDSPVIEIFGIKLYLDDIIILCILFVLYKEEVKDEMLFLSLILLLLS